MIQLRVHPDETVDFDSFRQEPAPAVALDGYVSGPSRYDMTGPWINLNHHEGVDRFGTRATCEQVAVAATSGLYDLLDDDVLAVHVNDADADVCLATWLLAHPERIGEHDIELLVAIEGALDTTGGCCATGADNELLERISWVFDPYASWRASPSATRTEEALTTVIHAVWERITAYANGRSGRADAASHLAIVARRGAAALIVEQGPLARLQLAREHVEVFITERTQGGQRIVSIGKSGPFVNCDLDGVWAELNRLEGASGSNRWGGGDAIGGSPRQTGTMLPLPLILDVVAARTTSCRRNRRRRPTLT